ncbi:MAG: response regulator [Gemmataceae bacterium]
MKADPVLTAVLVVDEDRDAADTTAHLIASPGHDVRAAYTWTGALILAGGFRSDVLVLDLRLPDGDGLAARLERVLGYHPVVIAVTGSDGLKSRSRVAGFDHHVLKPVAPDVLLAGVGQAARGTNRPSRHTQSTTPDPTCPASQSSTFPVRTASANSRPPRPSSVVPRHARRAGTNWWCRPRRRG